MLVYVNNEYYSGKLAHWVGPKILHASIDISKIAQDETVTYAAHYYYQDKELRVEKGAKEW